MKLNHLKGSGISSEYLCEITEELDKASGLGRKEKGWSNYHYIVVDNHSIKNKCLAIRVHGGTVGSIDINENNIITNIDIDTDYVVKTYNDDVKDILNKFIGTQLEWEIY